MLESAAANRKSSLGRGPKKRGVFATTDQNSGRNLRNVASELKLLKSSPYFKEESINDPRLSSILGGTILEVTSKHHVASSLDRPSMLTSKKGGYENKKLDKTSQLPPLHKSAVKAAKQKAK